MQTPQRRQHRNRGGGWVWAICLSLGLMAGHGAHAEELPEGGQVPQFFAGDDFRARIDEETLRPPPALPKTAQALKQAHATFEIDATDGVEAPPLPPEEALRPNRARTAPRPGEAAAPVAHAKSSFVPLCPTLNINLTYTLSGIQTGQAACYHFAIPTRAKSTVTLTNQSAGTNMALYVFKDDGANNLSLAGHSDNPGNANESVLLLTEPGNYYWYMEANTANGNPFNFGVSVNTVIDPFELNDTQAQATMFLRGLNVAYANSDSANDYDYYQYTAENGEHVRLRLDAISPANNNNWIVEVWRNGNWINKGKGVNEDLTGWNPQEVVTIRVRPNPAAVPSSAYVYRLVFGSKPVVFGGSGANGEYDVSRIPYGATGSVYLTTQVYRNLWWGITLNDSTGAPLPYVEAKLVLAADVDVGSSDPTSVTEHFAYTNSIGSANSSVNMGTCSGRYVTEYSIYQQGYLNKWRADYNVGWWRIEITGTPDIGIGGDNYPFVVLGHICDQTLIHSQKS